jgi:16S rRNA (uracil1498-N3)-methyltransferase
MRCFFCEKLNEEYVSLDRTEERHLFKVLRAEPRDKIFLIDGKGILAEGLVSGDKKIKVIDRNIYDIPRKRIHLFTALPRKFRMDTLLAQCTEAGMWAFHPIITDRSVVIPKKGNMTEKWMEKMVEACKQAKNPFVPEVYNPVKLKEAVDFIKENNIHSYYGSTKSSDGGLVDSDNIDSVSIAWFVGPEGGFSDGELDLLEGIGAKGISLGKWVMRVETAAVAGVLFLQQ